MQLLLRLPMSLLSAAVALADSDARVNFATAVAAQQIGARQCSGAHLQLGRELSETADAVGTASRCLEAVRPKTEGVSFLFRFRSPRYSRTR